MSDAGSARVVVGEIGGAFGVKGWVRVRSFTSPVINLVRYRPWYVSGPRGPVEYRVVDGRQHGQSLIVQLAGVADRDAAESLSGASVEVDRSQFAAAAEDEFFWTDLEGMKVRTLTGVELGVVDHLLETGANDVMVVAGERRRLIPFLYGSVVREVDLSSRQITVDWDTEF